MADSRRTLVIVPCGRAKVWDKHPDAGPTQARAAYVGAPFVVNREYAETFGSAWVVLIRPNSLHLNIVPPPGLAASPGVWCRVSWQALGNEE